MFEGIPYTVLGLGDTNYDKFCFMGKAIDKRLSELGGKRMIDVYCADEATDLEEVVEAWKIAVMDLVNKILLVEEEMKTNNEVTEEIKNIEIGDIAIEVIDKINLSSDVSTDIDGNGHNDTNNDNDDIYVNEYDKLPDGLIDIKTCIKYLDLDPTQLLSIAPDSNLLPRNKIINESDCPYQFYNIDIHNSNNDYSSSSSSNNSNNISNKNKDLKNKKRETINWTKENPFFSDIYDAKYLTTHDNNEKNMKWGEKRSVIHLELNIKNSNIQYLPGDSIGICCPNPSYLIDVIIQRLQLSHQNLNLTKHTLLYSLNKDDNDMDDNDDDDDDENNDSTNNHVTITLQELLLYKYDLSCIPKKDHIAKLAKCCTNQDEINFLLHLCSKNDIGKKLWALFIEQQQLKIGELIALLPSCIPTIYQLISCLFPMTPRYYSIASSPLKDNDDNQTLAIAFSIVKYLIYKEISSSTATNIDTSTTTTNTNKVLEIKRSGLCTSYLESILQPWLKQSSSSSSSSSLSVLSSTPNNNNINNNSLSLKLRIFYKPSLEFHLPCNVSIPLILIGPGTGVSPFIGFLQHRYALELERGKKQGQKNKCISCSSVNSTDNINDNYNNNKSNKYDNYCTTGMWRGNYEIEEKELPSELNSVAQYISNVKPGKINLFYGCRNNNDYLYKNELEFYKNNNILTELYIAMSRISNEKIYVTNYIYKYGKEICNLILDENASIYICGDGNQMTKDVESILKKCLFEFRNYNKDECDVIIKDMKNRKKYLIDVWS